MVSCLRQPIACAEQVSSLREPIVAWIWVTPNVIRPAHTIRARIAHAIRVPLRGTLINRARGALLMGGLPPYPPVGKAKGFALWAHPLSLVPPEA